MQFAEQWRITRIELVADAWGLRDTVSSPATVQKDTPPVAAPGHSSRSSGSLVTAPGQEFTGSSSMPDEVAVSLDCTTHRIRLPSATRCVIGFGPWTGEGGEPEGEPERIGIGPSEADVPEGEPDLQAAVPRCFEDWCLSSRFDPPCERTVPPTQLLQDRYAIKHQCNYDMDHWNRLTAVLVKMEPSFEPSANSIRTNMRDQRIAMPFVSGEVIDTCKFLKQFNSQAKCVHASTHFHRPSALSFSVTQVFVMLDSV